LVKLYSDLKKSGPSWNSSGKRGGLGFSSKKQGWNNAADPVDQQQNSDDNTKASLMAKYSKGFISFAKATESEDKAEESEQDQQHADSHSSGISKAKPSQHTFFDDTAAEANSTAINDVDVSTAAGKKEKKTKKRKKQIAICLSLDLNRMNLKRRLGVKPKQTQTQQRRTWRGSAGKKRSENRSALH